MNGTWEARPAESISYFPYSYLGALLGTDGEVVAAVQRILARGAEGYWLIQTPAGRYAYVQGEVGFSPKGDLVDEASLELPDPSREECLAAMTAIVKHHALGALQGDYAELRHYTVTELCLVCNNYRVRDGYLSRQRYEGEGATYDCLPAELYRGLVGFLREGSALCLGH